MHSLSASLTEKYRFFLCVFLKQDFSIYHKHDLSPLSRRKIIKKSSSVFVLARCVTVEKKEAHVFIRDKNDNNNTQHSKDKQEKAEKFEFLVRDPSLRVLKKCRNLIWIFNFLVIRFNQRIMSLSLALPLTFFFFSNFMDYMCCVLCDHQVLWCITKQKRILPRRYCLVMSCFLFHLESYTHFLRAAAIRPGSGFLEREHKKCKRKLSFKTHQRETVHYKGFSLELRAGDVNEKSKSFHTVYWTSMKIHRTRWYNVVRPILEAKGLTPGFDTLTWEILFILCPLQT